MERNINDATATLRASSAGGPRRPVSLADILPLKNQLYRLALRITLDSAEAEDIVQETYIKVWAKHDTWNEIDNMEAFCFTVCRNLALDSIKRQSSNNISLDAAADNSNHQAPLELPENEERGATDRIIARDNVRIVRQLVDRLPEKQRSCIQLRDFEGKPYKDIARIMNITEEQVKVNIFRARQTIKQQFQRLDNFGNDKVHH